MKLSKIYIIAAAFLVVGIIVFFVGFAMLGFNFSNFDTEPVYTPVKYTAEKNVPGIFLHDHKADVRFVTTDEKTVQVKYYENGIRTYNVTTLEDGTLSIELSENADWTHNLRLSRSTPVVTVSLPKNYRGNIKIESDGGDIEFDTITANDVSAKSTDGNIKVIGCTIRSNLAATTTGGNVELYNNTIKGAAQFNSNKGNILAQLISAKKVDINTQNGYMTLADVYSFGNIFGECTGGDIRISSLDCRYDITLITENGDIRGTLKGNAEDFSYNCNAQNGECNLPQNELGGSRNLILRTQNGDIDVNIATEKQ